MKITVNEFILFATISTLVVTLISCVVDYTPGKIMGFIALGSSVLVGLMN